MVTTAIEGCRDKYARSCKEEGRHSTFTSLTEVSIHPHSYTRISGTMRNLENELVIYAVVVVYDVNIPGSPFPALSVFLNSLYPNLNFDT